MDSLVKNKRFMGIDLLKTLAIAMVVAVHFFLNTKFYDNSINTLSMVIQLGIRNFCMSCVPLFMMITGYLNNKKDYDKKFFKGLGKVLIVWLFYSIVEFIACGVMNQNLTSFRLKDIIYSISSFRACHYDWYIEMYIGFYLLIPIFNRAYEAFDDKSKKIITFIMLFMTFIPIFVDAIFEGIFHLPSYWVGLYIFGYFLVGKGIAHFTPKYNKLNLIILLALVEVLGMFNGNLLQYDSLIIFIQTVLIFLIIYDLKFKSKLIEKTSYYIASSSLDIYLASSLIDIIIYKFLYNFTGEAISQSRIFIYFPIVVFISFTLSTIYASLRRFIIRVK